MTMGKIMPSTYVAGLSSLVTFSFCRKTRVSLVEADASELL